MSRVILLDAGPLGMVTHPRENFEIRAWLQRLIAAGTTIRVPEIADYEVRRELLRLGKTLSIARLELLKQTIGYLPINTDMMLKAAEFWAESRKQGRPAAPDLSLDADVILAAQAHYLAGRGDDIVVATTNVGHLARLADARLWRDIS